MRFYRGRGVEYDFHFQIELQLIQLIDRLMEIFLTDETETIQMRLIAESGQLIDGIQYLVTFFFHSDNGVRHLNQITVAFTVERNHKKQIKSTLYVCVEMWSKLTRQSVEVRPFSCPRLVSTFAGCLQSN